MELQLLLVADPDWARDLEQVNSRSHIQPQFCVSVIPWLEELHSGSHLTTDQRLNGGKRMFISTKLLAFLPA